ncbi:hypothetical protein [Paraglaciecola marina]|uniref:hypothetical protein n=1 Tax=Paraglaciecola marina TaxID=2500157 RepID=UPI00105B2D56|nr:hypothetical protein [Paraglaciecola marina]
MTDPLIAFLIELDKDEALKQKYLADPQAVAESCGLTPEDVAICVKNDTKAMAQRAEAEGADSIQISHAN